MERTPIRMVFADRGSFHDIVVHLPSESLRRYERIVDALREDPEITHEIWVDGRRLVAAYVDGNGSKG
jgi:hypothetical protein